jgi:hypothetical protein
VKVSRIVHIIVRRNTDGTVAGTRTPYSENSRSRAHKH